MEDPGLYQLELVQLVSSLLLWQATEHLSATLDNTENTHTVLFLKAGTSHLCDGSAHSSGCVVNGYGCLLSYFYDVYSMNDMHFGHHLFSLKRRKKMSRPYHFIYVDFTVKVVSIMTTHRGS